MVRDLILKIDIMWCAAIRSCCERIEQMVTKAKTLLQNGHPEEQKEPPPDSEENDGVTTILKRWHGL